LNTRSETKSVISTETTPTATADVSLSTCHASPMHPQTSTALNFTRLPATAPLRDRIELVNSNMIQPTLTDVEYLPYDSNRVYQRMLPDKKYVSGNWITVKVHERCISGTSATSALEACG
jgi:hypothetical protein